MMAKSSLNEFASLGRPASRAVRAAIQHAFATSSTSAAPPGSMIPITQAQLHLPVRVGDFTDFSCSRDHVLNAGEAVFGKRILPEGFRYFPLGYGGRSSSIVVSGTPVQRPLGQYRSQSEPGVVEFGPCQQLDYELEMGCIIGKPVAMGQIATAADADEHIFGVVLLDDWSGNCVS
jgi:fumarylacetoacetase